jgi:hypothetical protein
MKPTDLTNLQLRTEAIGHDSTTLNEIERLTSEHAALVRLQYEALQKSAYSRMSKAEADAYDDRLSRIVEIRRQLAQFRAEGNKV